MALDARGGVRDGRIRAAVVASWCVVVAAACGKRSDNVTQPTTFSFTNVQPPPGGVAQFSVVPVAPAPGLSLTALGNLNPPGHVLPTDHVYFYSWDLSKLGSPVVAGARPVFMPATAAVFFVFPQTNGEYKIMYRATDTFYFYFDHLVPSPVPKIGDVIAAGTQVGATTPGSTLDLGAYDGSVNHAGFLTPARYPYQTLHVVSPWKYFTPALQAQLYPQVYRAPTATDKDGKVDFGIAGKLSGDWFLQGMPVDSSSGPYGWTRSLSFAYDYYDPSLARISIGGTIGPPGMWGVDPAAPRFDAVSVQSGMVKYLLYPPFDPGFPPTGLLLVQLTNDTTIKVEFFPGVTTMSRDFDANAVTFVR